MKPTAQPTSDPKPDATDKGGTGLIDQAEAKIKTSVKPEYQRDIMAIVVAGRQLMFSQQTHGQVDQYLNLIKGPQDVPMIVAHGILKSISIIAKESRGKMSRPASIAAALLLMCAALRFLQNTRGITIDKGTIDATTIAITRGLFKLYNLTPQRVQQAVAQLKGGKSASAGPAPGAAPPPGPTPPPQGQGA